MDENRLPELPQESFRPMIAQSVQLEQFWGRTDFCFQDPLMASIPLLPAMAISTKQSTHCWTMSGFGIGVRSVGADWIPSKQPDEYHAESFVKLRISCKLVSATTMTKPWKDAKETS